MTNVYSMISYSVIKAYFEPKRVKANLQIRFFFKAFPGFWPDVSKSHKAPYIVYHFKFDL